MAEFINTIDVLGDDAVIDSIINRTIAEFKEFSDIIEEDVYDAISMETCVNGRTVIGGPAKVTTEKAMYSLMVK